MFRCFVGDDNQVNRLSLSWALSCSLTTTPSEHFRVVRRLFHLLRPTNDSRYTCVYLECTHNATKCKRAEQYFFVVFDLSRFCFSWLYFCTHRGKFYSLWIHFSSTFTHSAVLRVRQWIKAIIDFTPNASAKPHQSWPISTQIIHAQFGQRHTWISIFSGLAVMHTLFGLD